MSRRWSYILEETPTGAPRRQGTCLQSNRNSAAWPVGDTWPAGGREALRSQSRKWGRSFQSQVVHLAPSGGSLAVSFRRPGTTSSSPHRGPWANCVVDGDPKVPGRAWIQDGGINGEAVGLSASAVSRSLSIIDEICAQVFNREQRVFRYARARRLNPQSGGDAGNLSWRLTRWALIHPSSHAGCSPEQVVTCSCKIHWISNSK